VAEAELDEGSVQSRAVTFMYASAWVFALFSSLDPTSSAANIATVLDEAEQSFAASADVELQTGSKQWFAGLRASEGGPVLRIVLMAAAAL